MIAAGYALARYQRLTVCCAMAIRRCMDSRAVGPDGPSVVTPDVHSPEPASVTPSESTWGVLASAAALAPLRHALAAWAAEHAPDLADDLLQAVGEATANAVQHAYLGQEAGTMRVTVLRDHDGTVTATIADSGRWSSATPDPDHGRGLALMERLAAMTLTTDEHGTTVELRLTSQHHASATASG